MDKPIVHDNNRNSFNFSLTLFSDNGKMVNLLLPENPDGFYRFTEEPEHRFISIEAKNGRWMACCARPAFFRDVPPEYYQQIPLADDQLLTVEHGDRTYTIHAEHVTKESMVFTNYPVHSEVEITIGSLPSNDIVCNNPLFSRNHAILSRSGGKWQIRDCNSANGVFVNNLRCSSARLKLGDSIFIMGLRILIGTNFLAINSGDGRAVVNSRILRSTSPHRSSYSHYSGEVVSESMEMLFNRPPRKHIVSDEKTITVEAPPLSMDRAQMPLMLRMGGSMVTGGAAALAGNFTMLLSSVLFPFLSHKYTDKQREDYEKRRVTKYNEYLDIKKREILDTCIEEQQFLNKKYPDLNSVITQANSMSRLWERRPMDDDFACLRIGSGEQPLQTVIDYPPRRFELEPDELEEKMYRLVEQNYTVRNVPILSSFLNEHVCGVLGQRKNVMDFLRQLIVQTSILHSYDELKMIFLLSPRELDALEFIRYLPHTWDDMRSIRFIATNEAEAYKLGEYIKDQLPDDLDKDDKLEHILKKRPYYMIFALDKKLYDCVEFLKTVLNTEQNHGISLIAAFDDLPKECVKIFNIGTNNNHSITYLRQNSPPNSNFSMDMWNIDMAMKCMKMLSNLSLKATAQTFELPKMITFLEMFGAGRVEHLNPSKRWRENNPVKSLAAPVGIGPDGSLFNLDLHEKRQGPHGLVAGMTGSGKSEFIITYILSMAVNYHPDEVAFILIDYKGGGLAGAFENPRTGVRLPHLVGTITNLDGASIQRSLMSIQSELTRRQRIFNEAKAATNEGTMDIYAYQKLYRAHKVSEPMPHLFIISDEFAELKSQQPEFMDKLISAARIGRSLGVHLILATQKPAGVVNDQIRSNTKFRVCLRVQDRADSMDMLKRPEAAELTDTGRFYLQVGYNEFFALGQSAWCGASYEPRDVVTVQRDDSVEFLDLTGQVITQNKPKVRKETSGIKQIVAVVNYLSDIAAREGYKPRTLWREPLPKQLSINELREIYPQSNTESVSALMGIVDDPERQTQYPMTVDLQKMQNLLIVGEPASGKSTLLQTLLYTLSHNYGPDRVNFYILDFSNKLLSPLRELPHCGAYLTIEDEGTFNRFFGFISDEVTRRKKLFDSAGVTDYETYIQEHPLPLTLVVIDNLTGMAGSKIGGNILMGISEHIRNGANYGIRFVITANFLSEVNSKAKQALTDRITLKSKDRFTYGEILGKKTSYLPSDAPGRGMCLVEGRPLEYHCAMVSTDGSAQEQTAYLRQEIEAICQKYNGISPAPTLPMLVEGQTYESFCRKFKPGRIPLGYSVSDVRPVALPLKQFHCLTLYFGNPIGVKPVIDNFISKFLQENMEVVVVKKRNGSIFDDSCTLYNSLTLLDCDEAGTKKLWDRIAAASVERKPYRDEFCSQNGIPTVPTTEGDLSVTVNAWTQSADYIRERSKKLMIVFESFLDFCLNACPECKANMAMAFMIGKGTNICFTGCFYPDEALKISTNPILKAFNPDKHILLFGGRFASHGILTLPLEYKNVTNVFKNYNSFLMHYRDSFYPMQMPCGTLLEADADEDNAPII